jgi:uncharacterized glyoxalase superfamily protein PhnB
METIRCSLIIFTALVLAGCGGSSAETRTETGGTGETAPVAPVPPEFHEITPMLVVTDVAAAMAFYERAFGAERRYTIDGPGGVVMHGEVKLGDSIIMLSPEDAEHGARAPVSVGGSTGSLFVYVEDVDAAMARAVQAGATQVMPATDMFWGDRYGVVKDPSGHRWGLATHRLELTPEEIGQRGQAFMAAMASGGQPPAFTGGTPARSWKPEGYFTVTPGLVVSSPEAIAFYVRALGATERAAMLGPDGRLMHGEIQVGDSIIMLGQEAPEMEPDSRVPAHFSGAVTMQLMHYTPDADAAFARAVQAGATAAMPVSDMPWGDRFGQVKDPSGQVWGVATHVREVSPEEIQAAMQQGG